MPSSFFVIPPSFFVIPAKAGISGSKDGTEVASLSRDSRLRGNDGSGEAEYRRKTARAGMAIKE
jgi:hypothetical protein